MHPLWILPALMLAVLTYYVFRTRRSEKREKSYTLPTLPELPPEVLNLPEPEENQGRLMRWISVGEFMAVLKKCSDLIVIDLRAEAKTKPFPVRDALVLPVAPNDLIEVRECLPPGKSVAFCGASNLCIFLIATSPCMRASAPFYVLEGDLGLAEVA
ncbi:MAG: hypothetical protein WAM85_06635 [Terracidiphilus sp.]